MNKWGYAAVGVIAIALLAGFDVHRNQQREAKRARCAQMAAEYDDLRATIDRRIAGLSSASIETVRYNKPLIEEMDRKADALAEQMKPCMK